MKMDKEFLLKNRFWVGLVIFTPIWLIALIMILVIGGGSLAEGEKAVKDAKGKVTSINNPKTQHHTDPLESRRQVLQEQKDRVWQKAWNTQTDLMTWPELTEGGSERTREVYARLTKFGYFGEDIPYAALQDHSLHYKNQLPVEEVVRRTWPIDANWNQLIRRANFVTDRVPSVEEAWLAQEDLWVYNELINVLEAAQDSVARFENVAIFKKLTIDPDEDRQREQALAAASAAGSPGATAPGTAPPGGAALPGAAAPGVAAPAAPATPPAGEPGAEDKPKEPEPIHLRYRNPFWQLDLFLKLEKKKPIVILPKSTIRNVTAERVALPKGAITFTLTQQLQANVDPVVAQLTFEAEKPTPWMGWVELKKPVALPETFNADFERIPFTVEVARDDSWKPPAGALARYRFRSPNWEMDMIVTRDPRNPNLLQISEKSVVKNINLSRRALDLGKVVFRVSQGAGRGGFDFQVPADILPWDKTTEIKKAVSIGAFDPVRPLELKQIFTWPTSPIKRVNALALYYHSHKTANRPLSEAEQFKKAEDPAAAAASSAGAGGGAGGGMMGMPPAPGGTTMGGPGGSADGGMMGGMGGMGGMGRQNRNSTLNGLEKSRYITVTPQVRRMPVAISLIVDQAYMQDVLTAVSNSRLRIQITQSQWTQAENVRPPASDAMGVGPPGGFPGAPGGDSGTPDGGAPEPGMGRFGRGEGMRPGGMAPGGPSPGGLAPGGLGAGGPGAGGTGVLTQDETDPNLVDLAVYGIASLYERFPPKPKPGETGTTPPADASTTK